LPDCLIKYVNLTKYQKIFRINRLNDKQISIKNKEEKVEGTNFMEDTNSIEEINEKDMVVEEVTEEMINIKEITDKISMIDMEKIMTNQMPETTERGENTEKPDMGDTTEITEIINMVKMITITNMEEMTERAGRD
jgi:hypothetical protein